MDYQQLFAISAAGMAAERTRVEAASMNLANAGTVQDPGGAGYQPMRAVVRSAAPFVSMVGDALGEAALPTVALEPTGTGARLVHEPGHPLADSRGFVAYAGVDAAAEMVTLMSAMRSYEANVAALATARALVLKTLEIGRSS
jgi:flagellar basal-body rod protein FlgC